MTKARPASGDASSAVTLTAERTLQSQTYFECALEAFGYAFFSWPGILTTITVGCMIFLTQSMLYTALIQALTHDVVLHRPLTLHDLGINLGVTLLCLLALALLIPGLQYFTILTVIGRVQPNLRAGLTPGSLPQTLLNLFVFNMLFQLLMAVGILLLIVPGILVYLYCCHGFAMVVAVPCGPVAALKRSKKLSTGRLCGVATFSLIVLVLCCLVCGLMVAAGLLIVHVGYALGGTFVVVATQIVINYLAGGLIVFDWAALTALYLRFSEPMVKSPSGTAEADC